MAVSTLIKKLLNTCTKAKYKPSLRKASLGLATVLTVLSVSSVQAAYAAAIRTGLFDANTLARNDDGSTGLVDLGFTADFFGLNFTQLYVNNNGNVTFDFPLSSFTPFDLTSTGQQIIAPFFADVDTRNLGSNEVTYGTGVVDGRNAFGVNWIDVGYFPSAADRLNSFQLVLIDRSDTGAGNFDIEFNYDQIEWETGGASGGTDGLGGNSARVGFSNGTGAPGTFFELAGSAVNGAFLDGGPNSLVSNRLNSTVDGRYLFTARNGTIIIPPTQVPEPTTMLGLLAFGAIGATTALKRNQQQKAVAKV
ncbi:PEP-CTERM sorting domain-containing protein [Nostocales cyanobacterium LEGE 11386]|nr:PEP-CTERM sorting domain-containing protein [Nostocales cyanobacterium LEGE 11386]